ncbi:hypothetical protein M501DRAFT_997843 [Patellaria atrata CBS 101060]|uniref:Transcription factor IIIC putative zinc-finger domain-containing protein n=1 Tax=Patellaria atrata CBS 101060 TaxID=1346257 RepID=A0A9P4S3Q5_9PEZI|nr:hypothetical protein M501DRAFT_997843 [Patellaria atrata CBS 101060]
MHEPSSMRVFSIGEEISTSHVIDLEWSPPGLAQHRRCALAVLTSNLALSIWTAEGNPSHASNWKRGLVVNKVLKHYVSGLENTPASGGGNEGNVWRLRTRIRAFTWSPTLQDNRTINGFKPQKSIRYDGQLIAIANDYGEVFIIRIRSPYSCFDALSKWTGNVLFHFKSRISADPRLNFDEIIDTIGPLPTVDKLTWSAWSSPGELLREESLAYSEDNTELFAISCIAFATSSTLGFKHIGAYHIDSATTIKILGDAEDMPDFQFGSTFDINRQFSAPLLWIPRSKGVAVDTILVFESERATAISVPVYPRKASRAYHHHLDGRWDDISGVALGVNKGVISVHFTSHLSGATAPTTNLTVTLEDIQSNDIPAWQSQINESIALFSAEHDLYGNAQAKTWGLASSPLGDLIVSCVSVHPSDMVHYTVQSGQRSVIAVNKLSDQSDHFRLPEKGGLSKVQDISAETMLFSLRRWLSNSVYNVEDRAVTAESLVKQFCFAQGFSVISEAQQSKDSTRTVDFDTSILEQLDGWNTSTLVEYLRAQMYDKDVLAQARSSILISLLQPLDKPVAELRVPIIISLTSAAVLKTYLPATDVASEQIYSNFHAGCKYLDSVSPSGTLRESVEAQTDDQHELCEICDEKIRFESLDWARCLRGHQYVRCGLTFMAIQEPRVSRYCGLCKKQYLKPHYILRDAELRMQAGDTIMADAPAAAASALQQPTLAVLLLAACDVCIYCGGKFIF